MLRSVLSSFFPPAMMIVVLPENKKQAKLLKTLFFSYALFELHKLLPQIGPCPSMSTVPFWPSKTGNPGLQYWHLEPKYGS